MPYNQSASTSSATFGTFNDVTGTQTNTTFQGPVNIQEINVFNRHSNSHEAFIYELRRKLNPSIFTGNDRPHCLEDTRKQTLQDIYNWVDAQGYPNVFLLTGAAGTGKSTTATTVAGVYQRKKRLGCHMFFVRGRSDPGNVFQTIAYSLAAYSQNMAKALVEQLKDIGDLDPSSLKTKFDILLRDPLSAVAANVGPTILIVLDALDECGTPETRRNLMNILYNDLPTLPSNFRFLITARPEEDIIPFASSPPLSIYALNLDSRMDENRLDVYTYIHYELEKLKSSNTLVIPRDWHWGGGVQSLAESADGLFIWASTAINFISEKRLGRFHRLKDLVENRNRLDLNELYTTILKDAFEWDEEVKEAFVGVFSFILFSKSPLSDEAINYILRNDVASDILSFLRSLVEYEPGHPIMIRHASFYDYLVSCKGRPWYIDVRAQRENIASRCLERMGDSLKYDICNLQSSLVLNTDVPDLDDRVMRCISQFLKYICCNWAHHLQDVLYSQELCSQLRYFVYNQLLFWFEVLSITNTFNDNVGPALQFAIDWVRNNDSELSSFLRDANRQASIYSEPISKSVIQIYTSLLPLTKEDSLMSMHYAKYASTGCRVEYIGRKPRNDCIKTIQVRGKFEQTDFLLFSPDGTRVLSNSGRGVCVWEATSGKLITGPLADDEEINELSAAYLPDGRYVVVASEDCVVRKWDVLTDRLVWRREMDGRQIDLSRAVSAAFSPDGNSVVFEDQGIILVWDVETGKHTGERLEGHTRSVRCLAFSSDGKYLASGSDDTTIVMWDMNRREAKISPFERHTQTVTTVCFSPSGNNIASGSKDRIILVWNTFTGEVLREIKCENEVCSLTYSPNGLFILAGGPEWMCMWKVVDVKAPPKVFQVDHEEIWQVSFSPDSNRFVSVSGPVDHLGMFPPTQDDKIRIWDASWSVERTETTYEEQRRIESVALSPSGKFIASGSDDGRIYLWDVLSGELLKMLKYGIYIISVVFSPVNEQLVAFGSRDGTVQLWDVAYDEPIEIGNYMDWVSSVAFSPPDGKHVASCSDDKTICIWNIERRELAVGPLTECEDYVLAVAYSQDGKRLVSGSADNTVRIWNPETGQLLSTLNGHSAWVNSVAYSFDGSRIVSGSADCTILVWDAQSGEIICGPITGHDEWVTSVCFSLDGRRILSGSDDHTARVWDAITGQTLFPPFRGHTLPVESPCFFSDGRRFVIGSNDGTIRLWTLGDIPNDTDWELRVDGWVVSENGKLMMWIPANLRRYLCGHRNINMLNRFFCLRLHFDTD